MAATTAGRRKGDQTLASAKTAAVSCSGGGVNASRRYERPPPAGLSSRPGTIATPRRSAACANALESGEPGPSPARSAPAGSAAAAPAPASAAPGSRAQIASPPDGGAQSQAGRNDRSAAATAS